MLQKEQIEKLDKWISNWMDTNILKDDLGVNFQKIAYIQENLEMFNVNIKLKSPDFQLKPLLLTKDVMTDICQRSLGIKVKCDYIQIH